MQTRWDFWIKTVFLSLTALPWFAIALVNRRQWKEIQSEEEDSESRIPYAPQKPNCILLLSLYFYTRLVSDFQLWGPIVSVVAFLPVIMGFIPLIDNRRKRTLTLLGWMIVSGLCVTTSLRFSTSLATHWLISTTLCLATLDHGCWKRFISDIDRIRFTIPWFSCIAGFALSLPLAGLNTGNFPAILAMSCIGYFLLVFCIWRYSRGSDRKSLLFRLGDIGSWSVTTTMILCLLLEVYFRNVYDTSDGNSALLTAKAWKTRHVSYNSWGFRDDEFEPIERFDNHVRIMLLGDSFAFGNGINNKDDLLDSRLEKALSGNTGFSEEVNVFNISKPGWETATELAVFENYAEQVKPHIVLIQHLVNDIDDSVPFRPAQHFSLVKWIPLTDISYFLDFFIWHVYLAQQPKPADGFPKELHHYQDESVFANHAEIITDLVSAIRKQGAVPVAAVFPYLAVSSDSGLQREALDKVIEVFEAEGVITVDISQTLDSADTRFVVNAFDSHPNEEFWKIATKAIADRIRSEGLLTTPSSGKNSSR